MQLRTGHIPLNYFLHKINKVESLICPLCQTADKTIHHYLLDCPGFAYERHSLARATGHNSKSIRHLLGNWHAYKSVLTYVHTTERFKNTYGDLSMRLSQADAPHSFHPSKRKAPPLLSQLRHAEAHCNSNHPPPP